MEQLNGSQNVSETNSKNYSNDEIEGTPFRQISEMNENTGEWTSYLVMGDYRITEKMHSAELIEEVLQLKKMNWKTLTTIIAVIIEQTLKIKEEEKNNG